MKKITDAKKIILTSGFGFSGSGLINDYLIHYGFYCPPNIRISEFGLGASNGFSWKSFVDGGYRFFPRKIDTTFYIVSDFLYRLLFYPIRKIIRWIREGPFPLSRAPQSDKIHASHGVNKIFNIKPVFLNLFTIYTTKPLTMAFELWLNRRFKSVASKSDKFVIDKSLPSDLRILKLLGSLNNTVGLIVYRDPIIQLSQLLILDKSIWKIDLDFKLRIKQTITDILIHHYIMLEAMASSDLIVPVYFDKFISDNEYRKIVIEIIGVEFFDTNPIEYDFKETVLNNQKIQKSKTYTNLKSVSTEFKKIYECQQEFEVITYNLYKKIINAKTI